MRNKSLFVREKREEKMKETALQVLFFCKDELQEKHLHTFLKKFDGEVLISIPFCIGSKSVAHKK